jgi:hypothetical protein
MRQVVDRDHLIDGGDPLLNGLDPEYGPLDFANQLGAFPRQCLFTAHVVPLRKWSRMLPDRLNQVWWLLLPKTGPLCLRDQTVASHDVLTTLESDFCARLTQRVGFL